MAKAEVSKVALVDMKELFKSCAQTKDVQKVMDEQYLELQREIAQKEREIQNLRAELQGLKNKLLSPELTQESHEKIKLQRQVKQKQLKALQVILEAAAGRKKAKIAKMQSANKQDIMQEISRVVSDYSKEEGYDFVFDKSGKSTNQVSFFIFIKGAKDITQPVMKILNE